jgi:hypothetical protein
MSLKTDIYLKQVSSGTLLTILVISTFAFLVPLVSPASAATQALPTVTVTSGSPLLGNTAGQLVTIKVTNPASNPYSIVSISVGAPSGWTVTNCTPGASFLDNCVFSSSGAVFTASSSVHNLPPGQSESLGLTVTTPSGTYPFFGTFTTSVQDSSSAAYYAGPTFSVQVMDPTTSVSVTVTPASGSGNTATSYTAGTAPYTVTATVTPAQAGLPIVWSVSGYPSSASYSFTPASGTTDSTGKTSSTFQPSNHASDSGSVKATIGTSTVLASSAAITTQAGPPATVTVSLASSNPTDGNHYVTTSGTTTNQATTAFTGAKVVAPFFSFTLADAFGNAIPLNNPFLTAWTVTVQPTTGAYWDAHSSAVNLATTIKCTNGGSWTDGAGNGLTPSNACPSGSGPSYNIPYDYFQSGTYGYNTTVAVSISGTYNGVPFTGATGSSKVVMTSSFASSAPIPSLYKVSTGAPCTPPCQVQAGGQINVTASASGQANVPVTLYLDTTNSFETTPGAADYGANSMLSTVFMGGTKKINLVTKSNGFASALFTVDTVASSNAFFVESIKQPTDASLTNIAGNHNSSDTIPVATISGSPSTFSVLVAFQGGNNPSAFTPYLTTKSVPSLGLFVDVIISDAYGNLATNPGPGQIQITLTATGGTLSATNVYIPFGASDTAGSFGSIVWTMPSSVGQNVTLTASGVLSGQSKSSSPYTVSVVSPTPTLKLTSVTPSVVVNGVYVSKQTVSTISGKASASSGYPSSGPSAVLINSLTYKVDAGSVQSIPITPANSLSFSQILSLSVGLHTITINATDSKNNVATTSFQLLIDNSPPVVKFTTANNAVITNGAPVNATITVSQGDLNFTSVKAFGNGTTPLGVTVTGTNKFGSSVTYNVMISGLTSGTWTISLQAATLAGLSASATPITVKVLLPPNLTFTTPGLTQAVVNGQQGVNATIKNNGLAAKASVWFQLLNNKNQVVQGPTFVTTNFAAGQTQSFFFSFSPSLPHGTYTVQVFVTVNGLAYSQTFTLTVTL